VVYRTNPHTLEELKTNNEAAVANITVATLCRTSANIVKREKIDIFILTAVRT
jgi:hypothetical protein